MMGQLTSSVGLLLEQTEAASAEPLKQLNLFNSVITLLRSSLAADVLATLFKDVFASIKEKGEAEAEALGSSVIDAIDEVISAENDAKERQAEGFDANVLDRAHELLKELAVSSTYSTAS